MELAFIVYLIGVLPSIASVFKLVATTMLIIFVVGGGVWTFVYACDELTSEGDDLYKRTVKKSPWVLTLIFFMYLIAALIPSERTMYLALSAYGVQTLSENDKVQELGKDGVELLQEMMQRAKREMANDAVKDSKASEKAD